MRYRIVLPLTKTTSIFPSCVILAVSFGLPYTLVSNVSSEYKLPFCKDLTIALATVFSSIVPVGFSYTTYTKIECDSNGNYFDMWFNTLQPERYYRFVFRVDSDGLEKYYDNGYYFKLIR